MGLGWVKGGIRGNRVEDRRSGGYLIMRMRMRMRLCILGELSLFPLEVIST
jgi:hypothetical protein